MKRITASPNKEQWPRAVKKRHKTINKILAQYSKYKNISQAVVEIPIRPRDIFTIQYGADHDQFMFTCKGCSEKIAATQAFGQQPHSCKGKTIYIRQTSLYGVRL